MSLNSAVMSLGSGLSSLVAGAIIYQKSEHSALENYELVGYLAMSSTLLSLVIVRILKKLSIAKSSNG